MGDRLRPLRRGRSGEPAEREVADTAAQAQMLATEPHERLRGTLIVNPYSSGITAERERTVVRALRDIVDLDVRRTERSGHAPELARRAVAEDVDIVIACGGDGTANEVLNGMDLATGTAAERPMFTLIPGGGTNVLCRSLGLPNNPVRATLRLLTAIAARRAQPINLGRMDERLFMFSAGVGLDGAVVQRIEQKRSGRRPSDLSHLATIVGIFLQERMVLDERMTVHVEDTGEQLRAGLLLCGNTRPMSYMGGLPLNFMPDAKLEQGLDFIAPRRVSATFAIRNTLQAMGVGARNRRLVSPEAAQLHSDVEAFHVVCDEPQPCQVDGEFLGERSHVQFGVVRDAVRLVY